MVVHMEKYNNIVKIEEMKRCLLQGELAKALLIGRTISRKKLKSMSDLSVLAEAYFQNQEYTQAKEIFEMIYAKTKARRIVAQLVHLSIRMGDGSSAKAYLEEFKKIAPKDFYCHIFQYNLDKMLGADMSVLISDLEKLKKEEYTEAFGYELAKLYHKAGEKEKCVEECSNLILWFGNGIYVEKAKALRSYYLGEIDLTNLKSENLAKVDTLNQQIEKQLINDVIAKDSLIKESIEQDSPSKNKADKKAEKKSRKNAKKEASKKERCFDEKEVITESSELEIHGIDIDNTQQDLHDKAGQYESEQEPANINSLEEAVMSKEIEKTLDESEADVQEMRVEQVKASKKPALHEMKEICVDELGLQDNSELLRLLHAEKISLEETIQAYLHFEPIRKQIIRSMEQITARRSDTIHLMITGEDGSGKTKLAKSISKLMYQLKQIPTLRLAFIEADQLNELNLHKNISQLKECVLIVQHASKLSKMCIDEMLAVEADKNSYAAVILDDSRENINMMLRNYTELNSIYNNRIHLNKLGAEEYLIFAFYYARERDYEMDVEAYQLLFEIIQKQAKENRDYKLEDVISMMHDILQRAQKRSTAKLLIMTQQNEYEEHELMVIRKQDILL